MADENIVLNDAEKQDLQEAVDAEQELRALPEKFAEVGRLADSMAKAIFALLGTAAAGQLAYSRGLAIQRLEECMHRVAEGVSYMRHQGAMEEEAVRKAQSNGKIINFTGGKV